jgi:hypothetical protein
LTQSIHRQAADGRWVADFKEPVVSGIPTAAANAINQTIRADVEGYLAEVDQEPVVPGDDPSSISGTYKVGFVSSSLLSISFEVDNYATGTNHGIDHAGSLTFAVSSGAQIHLADLFADQSAGLAVLQTQAHNLVWQLLLQTDGSNFATLQVDPATWSMANFDTAWVISPAGLQLGFTQGDLSAMADGLLTITIPWSALAGVVRADGPAGPFAK